MKVMPGQVLLYEHGKVMTLYCVCGIRAPRKKDGAVSATLRAFSGRTGDNGVYASSEASATFPDGEIAPPFHLVTATDAVRGKFPGRIEHEHAYAMGGDGSCVLCGEGMP